VRAAPLMLVGALAALLTTPDRAWAVQQYTCSSSLCTCIGTSDCIELLDSGWCKSKLKCGTDAGLPPDKCKCSAAKTAPGVTPGLKSKPGVQARLNVAYPRARCRWSVGALQRSD
jgi:hypothetical protein